MILPALIGLSRAFQGSARSRRKLFASLYSAPLDGPSSTSADDDEGDTVFEVQWKAADVEEFYDTVCTYIHNYSVTAENVLTGQGCKLTPARWPVAGEFSVGQVKYAVGLIGS